MKKLTIILATTTALLFTSCMSEPVRTTVTDNPDIKVDYLFKVDGVKVYRFEDGSQFHYVAIDSNRHVEIQSSYIEHKREYSDNIQTIQ